MKNKNENIIKSAILDSKWSIIYRFIVLSIFIIIGLIIPVTQGEVINSITEENFHQAYIFLLATLIAIILENLFSVGTTHSYWNVQQNITNYLSDKMISETLKNSMYSLSRFNFSLYRNIIIKDIETIAAFISKSIIRVLQFFELAFIIAYIFSISAFFGVILIFTLLVVLLVLVASKKKIKKEEKIKVEDVDKKMNSIFDIYVNIREIKDFNLRNVATDDFLKIQEKSCKSTEKSDMINFDIAQLSLIIIELSRYFIYAIGIYMIMDGKIEIGTILIVFNYYAKIIGDIDALSNLFINYNQYKVALKRYNTIFKYTRDNNIEDTAEFINGDIAFKNIVYGDINDLALNNISLVFKNNNINLIDTSKESYVNSIYDLLSKFNYQHSGTITINGTDISAYNDEDYRSNVARASKSPMFFNTSIKDNLLLISEDIENTLYISKLLNIHDQIMELPDGYDTVLKSDCSNIPFKMRYLLEILRIFVYDHKILLFEDIFDVLDEEDIDHLIKVLNNSKDGRTIIIKTSNKDIMDTADNIVKI